MNKLTSKKEKIILGIDPGTNVMGYGVIKCQGQDAHMLDHGVFKFKGAGDQMKKLQQIYECCHELVKNHKPDEFAIEAPFYGKNVQSMLKLGRAQGISIAAALHHNVPVFEYAPRKVKQSITGKGAASKEQVAGMIQHLLKLESIPEYLDATDGLAVAVCHFFQSRHGSTENKKSYHSWKAFLSDNPNKIA